MVNDLCVVCVLKVIWCPAVSLQNWQSLWRSLNEQVRHRDVSCYQSEPARGFDLFNNTKRKIRRSEINRDACFLLLLLSRIKFIISNQQRQLVFIPFRIPATSKNNIAKPC